MGNSAPRTVAKADGKLGVLCVGLGAVASTFIAGVELVRRGITKPYGSLTQMATIRLGKRTENRAPLDSTISCRWRASMIWCLAAWDPVPDDAYQSCLHCGVFDKHEHVEPIREFLEAIKPMPAAFDQAYVKRLEGTNVKRGKNKRDLAEQLRQDIRDFKADARASRAASWCGARRPRSSSFRARRTRTWPRSRRRWRRTIRRSRRRCCTPGPR